MSNQDFDFLFLIGVFCFGLLALKLIG